MRDHSYLSRLEREFYATRKQYLDQIETTTRLLNAEVGFDLATVKLQWDRELRALHRYQEARSVLLKALAGTDEPGDQTKAA